MAVYRHKDFLNNGYNRPDHDIDVRDKNSEWIGKNFKYMYGQYLMGQTGITPEDADRIDMLRSYMDGKQPWEQYRKKYLNESKEARKNEFGYINWEDVYSPMPKIVDKVLGMFTSQEHSVQATCVNEKAKQYRVEKYAEKYTIVKLQETRKMLNLLRGVNPDEDPMLNPAYGFIEKDLNEIDIIASSGNFKIPYEIGSEKVIDFTKKASNYKHFKREAVRDLMCGFIAMADELNMERNMIRWANVDITDVIIEYTSNSHFSKSRYCGIQELWTIEDLRTKGFKEEDLKKIAGLHFDFNKTYLGLSDSKNAFEFYSRRYNGVGSYGYDCFVVPVLYGAFKSHDITYSNKVKNKAGEDVLYKADFGKLKQNTVIDSVEKVYEGRWIIGTDNIFDDGVLFLIPRDSVGNALLPLHVSKLKGKSLVERCLHPLNELAMLGYKLQHTLARSQGKQPVFDMSSIETVTSNTGGKLHPLDLLEMYWQGQGMLARSIPLDETVNYSRPQPVIELPGGIGAYLNELMILKQSYTNDIIELTGINSIDNTQNQPAVGIAQIAVANMADVLRPYYDIYLETKERLAYNTVYRVQLLLFHDEKLKTGAFKIYSNAIGKHYAEYLKLAGSTEPMDMGISFEASPTQQTKDAIMAVAGKALQPGKNGTAILRMSEYLYLADIINTQYGLKEARLLLEYRENQDDMKARQQSMQAIQAQSQAIEQQIAVKAQMDNNKEQSKSQGTGANIQLKSDLDLRNAQILAGNKAGVDMMQKGVDMASQQEQQQMQTQTQPQ